mgnify:CR=1 FL=1
MAKTKAGGFGTTVVVPATPKKTRQGNSMHSKYSATSRNKAKKRYRGQGK